MIDHRDISTYRRSRLSSYPTRAVATLAISALLIVACSSGDDDDDNSAGTGGAVSGSGGMPAAGTGGTSGSGAAGTTAGSGGTGTTAGSGGSMSMDAGMTCVPNEPVDTASQLPKCSPEVCPAQDSVCVPTTLLEAMSDPEVVEALADCDDNNKCVPAALVDTMGKFIPASCRSLLDAEGRCLSSCIPQVASQASQLPKDSCNDGELCAPCYDPRTGEATAACRQSCDPGPTEPAKTFPTCCEDKGFCVSTELAGDQAESLEQNSCGDGLLCAPKDLTDPTFIPKTCRSINDSEGRCLSVCAASVAAQIDQLPVADCAEDERCAPCYDPRGGGGTDDGGDADGGSADAGVGADTGACRINGDHPAEGPKPFAECCDSAGFCVSEAEAGDQASSLEQNSCETPLLCAPKELTDPGFTPMTCDSIEGREGRCLSECVANVRKQLDKLPTEGCMDREACAPCFDPITDEDTGACNINGDVPVAHDPPFDKCCDNGQGTLVGVCVTPELAGEQADILKLDTCDEDYLCAPIEKAKDSSYKFPTCTVTGGTLAVLGCQLQGDCSGACVPSCILSEDQVSQLERGTCGIGEMCAPCTDPTSGDPSGACD